MQIKMRTAVNDITGDKAIGNDIGWKEALGK